MLVKSTIDSLMMVLMIVMVTTMIMMTTAMTMMTIDDDDDGYRKPILIARSKHKKVYKERLF